jgi:hypothetical protein
MFKLRYIAFVILLAASVFGLFQVKFKVQTLHRELAELKQQLEREKNAIHVLKAEWAYLNQPERLNRLVVKFLDLSELKSEQIMLSENTQNKILKAASNKNSQIIKASYTPRKAVKWRYKDRPDLRYKK